MQAIIGQLARQVIERIAQEMDIAALPGSTGQDLADRLAETLGIGRLTMSRRERMIMVVPRCNGMCWSCCVPSTRFGRRSGEVGQTAVAVVSG